MKFGPVPVDEAAGCILAHSVRRGALVLRKGIRLKDNDALLLKAAGVETVTVARLEEGDVGEDAAALAIAETLAGAGVHVERPGTGRANLTAEAAGVFRVDADAINGLNAIDGAITVATLADFRAVRAGEIIATVKIMPFAVSGALLNGAVMAAGSGLGALSVARFTPKRVGIISTLLSGLKPGVIDKAVKVTAERLAPTGSSIVAERRVEHDPALLAEEIKGLAGQCDLIVIFGASAIADRADVIPMGIELAGGMVEHFGMPVDPGNLLLLGRVGSVRVLGAPGCARSPKENGFDWVLQRLLANIPVSRFDIQMMGVGGLLGEIAVRPQPREGTELAARMPAQVPTTAELGVVVLAAGQSTRMGGTNKLLADLKGAPMVRRTVDHALAAGVGKVIVVTGHEAERVEAALAGLPVTFVRNAGFAGGLASSLQKGLASLPPTVAGAIVLLGDMPLVHPEVMQRLAAAFADEPGVRAVVPTLYGQRGNPVVLARAMFADVARLSGDAGARALIEAAGGDVAEVAVDDPGILRDFDTPEALDGL